MNSSFFVASYKSELRGLVISGYWFSDECRHYIHPDSHDLIKNAVLLKIPDQYLEAGNIPELIKKLFGGNNDCTCAHPDLNTNVAMNATTFTKFMAIAEELKRLEVQHWRSLWEAAIS